MSRHAFIRVARAAVLALAGATSVSCGCGESAHESVSARGFEVPGALGIQLDRAPATFALPDHNLPPGFDLESGSFELELRRPPRARKDTVYAGPLPFNVPETARRFAPRGMKVLAGDEEIPFSTAPPGHKPSWRLQSQRIVVAYPELLESVRLVYPTLTDRIDRLSPARSGLSADEFVRHHYLLDGISRSGLLLPAPATATWEVELPTGAHLRTHLTLIDPPLKGHRSDGAEVVFSVDGKEVGRQSLSPDDEWVPVDLDLSAHTGASTLEIRVETGASPDFDYVFVGSPAIATPDAGASARRILVIGMDTTRPDHMGLYGYERPTTPELDAFVRAGAIFDAAWCPAPRTRPSFRSSSTGRWPLQAVGATNIGEVFRENGWATGGFAANVHLNPRFGFDAGFDLWQLDVQATADEQVDRALSFFRENAGRDSYVFLHIMDPHLFYKPPEDFAERFVRDPDPSLPSKGFNRWEVYNWQRSGELTDQRKQHVLDLYDAELAYADQELGRLFRELDTLPGETLVVVHNDHGEEFWEHGGYEHNHTLFDEVTKAVLAIRPPGGMTGSRIASPASLVDIAPTVFDYAGIRDLPELDGRSLRPFVEGGAPDHDRDLPVAFLRYDRERWGVVVDGRYKYILHTGSGREELYDLQADPGEHTDLASEQDTTPYWKALGTVHQIPVGPGWRIRIRTRPGSPPVELSLPARALGADVLNPEALSNHRANLAWGEKPKKTSDDVGVATLSVDGKTLRFEPGPDGSGTVWVLFESPVEPGGTLVRDGATLALAQQKRRFGWVENREFWLIEPGIVVVPPIGEAARMRAGDDVSSADLELLTALGYVGEEAVSDDEEQSDDAPE